MGTALIRVWQAVVLEEVQGHLLIVGDTHGDCAGCRAFGIDYRTARSCPGCQHPFHFVTSRRIAERPTEAFHIAQTIRQRRPDLLLIDYADYQRRLGTAKGRAVLGGGEQHGGTAGP